MALYTPAQILEGIQTNLEYLVDGSVAKAKQLRVWIGRALANPEEMYKGTERMRWSLIELRVMDEKAAAFISVSDTSANAPASVRFADFSTEFRT